MSKSSKQEENKEYTGTENNFKKASTNSKDQKISSQSDPEKQNKQTVSSKNCLFLFELH
jgi:hypothetical protein